MKKKQNYKALLSSHEDLLEEYSSVPDEEWLQYFRHDAAHCAGNIIHLSDIINKLVEENRMSNDELKRLVSGIREYAEYTIVVVDAAIAHQKQKGQKKSNK